MKTRSAPGSLNLAPIPLRGFGRETGDLKKAQQGGDKAT